MGQVFTARRALAAMLVVGGFALAGCGSPAGTPPAGNTSAPSGTPGASAGGSTGTASPRPGSRPGDELFLAAGDIGSGWKVETPGENGNGDWSLDAAMSLLGCQTSAVRSEARREKAFESGPTRSLVQSVERFTGDGANRYLADLRARVVACKPAAGTSVHLSPHSAGQDAVFVEVINDQSSRYVFVRQGELVTELGMNKAAELDYTVRDVSAKAAQRLCAGTTAC